MNKMVCRLCGKFPAGGYLQRVNGKGVAGIWECRPICGSDLPQETSLLLAIESEEKEQQ